MQVTQQKKFVDPDGPLWNFIKDIAEDESLTVYDISRPRNDLLRIFIDKVEADKLKGSNITVDDCTNVCRRLMHAFAVEGSALGVGESPELEVSSPGLDRFLRLDSHFKSAVGSSAKVWIDNKVVTGNINAVTDSAIVFKENSKEEFDEYPFSQIKKAQLIF